MAWRAQTRFLYVIFTVIGRLDALLYEWEVESSRPHARISARTEYSESLRADPRWPEAVCRYRLVAGRSLRED